ncbi:hypothetical protein EDC94DRAFT_323725 [Helicostylum pulchrum]|nr:hypothetical protein EDC94DRAFT_323725 [Helicostylum pulchrum]
MEDTSSIYWSLLETETDNPELYFPPDTPVSGANPRKLYTLYQKRHARQKERLIKQQVAELYKYRETFSTDLKESDFMNTPSTVCELITGNDFLNNESDAISQLLFGIPNFITQNLTTQNENQKRKKPDDIEAKKQEYLEDLTKQFKAGSGTFEKNHQLQLDSLKRLQKSDINSIPREILIEMDPKRYKTYSSSPESLHGDRRRNRDSRRDDNRDQRDKKRRRDDYRARSPVRDYRRERSPLRDSHRTKPNVKIPSSSPPPPPPPPSQRRNHREPVYTSSLPPPPPPPSSSTPPQRGNHREPIYTSSLPNSSVTQLNQAPPASIVGIPTSARPPTVISSPATTTPNKSGPPTVQFSSPKSAATLPIMSSSSFNKSGPPTVQFSSPKSTARLPATTKSGPPTVQFSSYKFNARPPSVDSSPSAIGIPSNNNAYSFNPNKRSPFNNGPFNNMPPYVAQPSSEFTQPHDIITQNERRSSSTTPLFTPRPPRKIETLMDKGSLIIFNKPSRVLIRQPDGTAKAYGNPKDYDDAIYSRTTRPDNPVYKRHMNGVDYLFYKTDAGNVVTIGPVSKIQPLIHKYFLSI